MCIIQLIRSRSNPIYSGKLDFCLVDFFTFPDVDPSALPQMDSQPLSLEDSGRLRVVSAKVYSIVKNRDIQHFERVLNFLEDTYRLMPRLVTPIKHMKIMFGLKTMVRVETGKYA